MYLTNGLEIDFSYDLRDEEISQNSRLLLEGSTVIFQTIERTRAPPPSLPAKTATAKPTPAKVTTKPHRLLKEGSIVT